MSTSKNYRNWALIAIAMLLFGTAIATIQFKVPVVMGDIMTNMNMDTNSASWLMSIFTFVGIVLAIPTGALAKKFGPKTMLLAAAVIIAAGSLLGAFAGNGMVLIVSRAIEGVAFIFVTICGPLAVQKYVAPEKIGSATGIWALWVCLGSVVGGVLTPTLYAATGFVGVWVIYAAAAVVFAIVVAVVVKHPSEALDEAATAATGEKVSYGELVKPNILLFFFAFLVFNMTLMAVLSFGPTFMQQQGVDPTLSGFISTLPMLLAVISSPLFGALSDKLGLVQAAVSGFAVRHGPLHADPVDPDGALDAGRRHRHGPGRLGRAGHVPDLVHQCSGSPRAHVHRHGRAHADSEPWAVPGHVAGSLLLGPDVSAWMFTGIVMCVIGFAGTAAVALCKFK